MIMSLARYPQAKLLVKKFQRSRAAATAVEMINIIA
jgi:hypothetical protein